ncbi:F0F1 ATP synthase subunit delta [Goodfellowiella coeruleoviolacea]|uniref:ATP synthase subunit delta n=1 Tax=Goodfellowiella coeruleoviolacea TaxID=334858 RepID=A0AAE3KH50_9PSEU|nr:F0F1 ATP synthase subunit delta [Goodfellowiella coeruleoviolacea]MCP2166940.1 ATP synthase F1 subcomplex delta subunit [Goodfellowiella coeruleoviolacea]
MTTLLHAASREALAAAELRLLEVADSADAATLSTLGEELFAVVNLLFRETGLRRALADASSEPTGREALLRGLLEGKVADPTLQVLTAVVTARWSSPRELLDGVESLARTALLVRAEREDRLDTVEDELFRLGRIVAGQPDLDRLLSNPATSPDGRIALVKDLIGGKAEPITQTLVVQLVAHPEGRDVVEGLDELASLAARRRERSIAYVRSAVELTEAQRSRLAATLTRIYSRPIALHVQVDRSIGGGLLIKVGDEVIDGSIQGRLNAVRRELAG